MKIRLLLTAFLASFFFLSQAQVNIVSITGSATDGGWDTDADMIQDATDTSIWTLNIDLTEGAVKFRANNAWDINWGATEFPTGVGTQGGADIPVIPGNYDVTFNHTTGVYSFSFDSPIGIIGEATPGGWAEDTNMFYSDADGVFFITLDLVMGPAKFRKDDNWDVNWGSTDFPSGIGVQEGDNIPIPNAGTYYITLDTASGEYNFVEQVSYETIGILGDATPGGWDEDTDMTKDADNPDMWTVFIELTDGKVKFRADNAWTVSWGGSEFPIGVATQGGDDIPVTAGYYRVDFNSETGDYSFTEVGNYETIGIIGTATPGGWGSDTDMMQDEDDPTIWRAALALTDGEAKFRADDAWDMDWGGSEFPIGVAVPFGANIPVEAGEYNITFNTLTGEYSFEVFVVYDQISLVGKDGPFGAWPAEDDMGAVDTYLTIDEDNNQLWRANPITLTEADTTASDSGVKFRADTDWTINWGSRDFPGGTGTQSGDNIWCPAGTYKVVFNTETGEYLFSDPTTSTEEVLSPSSVKVYPNPASQNLNVNLEELNVSGQAVIRILDMQGKVLKKTALQLTNNLTVDVSSLNTGNYLLNISNGEFSVGKKFAVVK